MFDKIKCYIQLSSQPFVAYRLEQRDSQVVEKVAKILNIYVQEMAAHMAQYDTDIHFSSSNENKFKYICLQIMCYLILPTQCATI